MLFRSGASGAIIVCDVQRSNTTGKMLNLAREMEDRLPGRPHICVFNKTDISQPPDDAIERIRRETDYVTTCSAKDGTGVIEALQHLTTRIMDLEHFG